jgi:selenide, water dikinase
MEHSSSPPLVLDVVLVGCGHAHVHALKMFGMPQGRQQLRSMGVRITIISSHTSTPYSGMLPGYIAGHYANYNDIHLNVMQLARFANARFIHAAVDRITYDRQQQQYCTRENSTTEATTNGSNSNNNGENHNGNGGGMIYMSDGRPPLRYDCLSLDIGSAPPPPPIPATMTTTVVEPDVMIPVKPIANLCQYWDVVVQQYQHHLLHSSTSTSTSSSNTDTTASSAYTLAIVGGGAGGIELALSMQHRLIQILRQHYQDDQLWPTPLQLQVILLTRGSAIMEATNNVATRKKLTRILAQRNIQVYYNAEVERVVEVCPTNRNNDTTSVPEDPTTTCYHHHQQRRRRRRQQLILTPNSKSNYPHPRIIVDACFGCMTAGAASWLSTATPFAVTPVGNFVRVHDTYEVLHHTGVFASGDCCHMDLHPRPKAGVFAVRAGPILYSNILRYVQGRALIHHQPQATYLSLISTGDKYAVASKGRWICLEGRWLWRWKDWIDRRWMAKYSTKLPNLEIMMSKMQLQNKPALLLDRKYNFKNQHGGSFLKKHKGSDVIEAFTDNTMRCGGCGAKVGATIVSRVLKVVHERQIIRAKELGYEPPPPIDHDDAAITFLPTKQPGTNESVTNGSSAGAIIQTIDYFREMISDPYIFGKIVAVHALSDIHAMGATAQTAMALAVAPFAADDAITESTLVHLMSGVSDVLQDEGIRLVGGHTCEGIELACGLSVQGYTSDPHSLWRKRGGRIGDKVILTKPLGTGALFAAEMRAEASSDHIQDALQIMLQSNYVTSCAAREFCMRYGNDIVHACTDVTGFGLIGHLLEMLLANETDTRPTTSAPLQPLESIGVVLDIHAIPFYRGGLEASSQHVYSSLQKQNTRNRRAVLNHVLAAARFSVEFPLLFDPQTAGGLLFFIDPKYCDSFLLHLTTVGRTKFASVIGEVLSYSVDREIPSKLQHLKHQASLQPVCSVGNENLLTYGRVHIKDMDVLR